MPDSPDYLVPNWDQPRPSPTDIVDLWKSMKIDTLRDEPPDELLGFVNELRRVLGNGQVLYAQFQLHDHPTLAWFASRNLFETCAFVDNVLRLALRTSAASPLFEGLRNIEAITEIDPILLDGTLALRLVQGGAYQSLRGREVEAKRLGTEAAKFLTSGHLDRDSVLIYQTFESWSDWFLDVAWDSTLFVFEKRTRRFSILAGTDTD
ncbi:MAG: hypothetical protein H7210_12350 [Pyrinomonadaceae bacterium]|nr:hypothetical protein [Phycisphaerales bacterium]